MTVLSSFRKHPIATLAATLIAAVLVGWWLNPWHADAAGETESVYVGIEPTRCIDTRPIGQVGPHSTFQPGETKTIQISGVAECGVPAEATAVLFNLSGIGATDRTFLSAYPSDGEQSLTSVLNPSPANRVVGNAVTVAMSSDGAINMFNNAGTVDATIDTLGYYVPASTVGPVTRAEFDELQSTVQQQSATISELNDTVDQLNSLLAGVSRAPDDNGYDTVTFSGVNLQIVDGTGSTYENASGLGNVIIGYNRATLPFDERNGAHNLVIGDDHSYGGVAGNHASGGIVSGFDNTIRARGASVTGGERNRASGLWTSVTGGSDNIASLQYASVSGGQENTANGVNASVAGGRQNFVSNSYASIAGGQLNQATGAYSSIGGGHSNQTTAGALHSVVVGGIDNAASGNHGVVVGGDSNVAAGDESVAVGGLDATAVGSLSVSLFGPSNQFAADDCNSGVCASGLSPYN